jgi:hypothetical protein
VDPRTPSSSSLRTIASHWPFTSYRGNAMSDFREVYKRQEAPPLKLVEVIITRVRFPSPAPAIIKGFEDSAVKVQ